MDGHAVRDWSGMPATKNEKKLEAKKRGKYEEETWRILRMRMKIRSQLQSGEKMRLRDEVARGFD
jgi:hypothetical protein